MNIRYLTVTWAALTLSTTAYAETFTLDLNEPGVDPALGFEDECLGDSVAEDCDERAAWLESQLFTLLVSLDGNDEEETVALFKEALDLDSPSIQALALQYLTRTDNEPSDFLSKLKTFFLGSNPKLAAAAAGELRNSNEDSTQAELAEFFEEQRNIATYNPAWYDNDDFTELPPLVMACINDAQQNLMDSFTLEERFTPAERFLAYDRMLVDLHETGMQHALTSYVTDASLDEVLEHFTAVFGADPYPSTVESEARFQELLEEMLSLQQKLLSGDSSAAKKMEELSDEMTAAQTAFTVGLQLQWRVSHAEENVFWVDSAETDFNGEMLPRAVNVGVDPYLDRVVIRYVNGAINHATRPSNGPSEQPGGGDGTDDDTDSDQSSEAPNDSGSGSGCHLSHMPSRASGWMWLTLLAVLPPLRRLGAPRRRRLT